MSCKHYHTLLLLCILMHVQSTAQVYPCFNFNSPGLGNWTLVSCYLNTTSPSFTNPLDNTRCLSIRDNNGISRFENELDFKDLGARFPGDCLSFDYNVSNDGMTGSAEIKPTIYLSDIAGRTISFTAYASLKEGAQWMHVRAPLIHYDYAKSSYPSGPDGQWENGAGLKPADFDYIMDHTNKVYFIIDIVGSDVTTEDIRLDNICVGKCRDSASRICNANFTFTLNMGTNPAYRRQNHGEVALLEYHKTSRYQYLWGDTKVTDTAESHRYDPGTYLVKVRETTETGVVCTSSLNICVTDPPSPKTTAGPLDSPCDAHFTMQLVSATNRSYSENNIAYLTLAEPNASSTYKYEWGDGNVDYWQTTHHYNPDYYYACATETQVDRTSCKNCLKLCIIDPAPATTRIKDKQPAYATTLASPNPANLHSELPLPMSSHLPVSVQITDITGKTIFEGVYERQVGTLSVTTRDWPDGIYLIGIRSDEGTFYQKLMVQH